MNRAPKKSEEERRVETERIFVDSMRKKRQDIVEGKIEDDSDALEQSFKEMLDEYNIVL